MDEIKIAQICLAVPTLKKYFAGVLPRGYYPKHLEKNTFLIYNNQLDSQYGDHWLLVFYHEFETVFMDSFGWSESFYEYYNIVERNGVPCVRNVRQIQNEFSSVCGHHCIFVAYHLAKGFKFNAITEKLYSRNTTYNDKLVFDFVEKLTWKYLKTSSM